MSLQMTALPQMSPNLDFLFNEVSWAGLGPPQNLYAEALTSSNQNITLFGNRVFKGIMTLKLGHLVAHRGHQVRKYTEGQSCN